MPMILNEEQNMLRDTARDFCANNMPISQLRRLRDENSADGFDRGTWKAMVELGWAGIPFPEAFGGLEFGYKGLGVVTEETGRTLGASPLFASVWVSGTAVNIGGSDAHLTSHIGACLTRFEESISSERDLVEAILHGRYEPLWLEAAINGAG